MQHLSPLVIIPKFLWKQIAHYLSYNSLVKLTIVNNKFINIIDDNNCKEYFLDHRKAIITVKCTSIRVNFFWKYALENHAIHDNINDMFFAISRDNKATPKSDYVYYKVFIKSGVHKVYWFDTYRFDYNKCSIELIGNKSTKLYYISHIAIKLYLPHKCSISNITFSTHIFDFEAMQNNTELHIADCVFENNESPNINVNILTITNCVFNMARPRINSTDIIEISNCIFNNSMLILQYINYYKINSVSNYIIAHNTFICISIPKCIYLRCNNSVSSITIADNIISNSNTFCSVNTNNTIILFRNNTIANTKTCLTAYNNIAHMIVFENNIFDNVTELYDNTKLRCVQLKANNQYINCGVGLTKHAMQE